MTHKRYFAGTNGCSISIDSGDFFVVFHGQFLSSFCGLASHIVWLGGASDMISATRK